MTTGITFRQGIRKRLIFPVVLYVVGVVLFAFINYQRTKSVLLSGVDDNLFIAAQSVKNALPANFHDYATSQIAIDKKQDWKNIKALTNLANNMKIDFLYTVVIKNHKVYFTSCSTTASEINQNNEAHYWLEYPEASNSLPNIAETKKIVYETTVDRWGKFRSVLVPVYSPKGNLYIIGADYEISYITGILNKEVFISLLIGLFLSFLVLPFAFKMLRIEKEYSRFLHKKVQERTTLLSQEISERKRTAIQLNEALAKTEELAEKAQEANKVKGEFLATMSHEIRTPLNVIVGMSTLLNQTGVSSEQADYLKTIKNSSDHLLNLIDSILDFSIIESNRFEVENVRFDIHELVNYSINSFISVAKHKNITLESKVDEKIPKFLMGDPSYLRQILFNLVGNAVKFTEKGMVMLDVSFKRVIAETREIEIQFHVSDTGIGIPTNVKDVIFDKFCQADSSTKRKFGGTGMGLAICKHLVSLLNGKIWFDSNEGSGSSFYFILNFSLPNLEFVENTIISEEKNSSFQEEIIIPSLNILLAEDNLMNVKVAKSFLEKSGHTVTVAINGLEVLQKVKENDYNLILMDIEMPEMDGLEATAEIRKGLNVVKDINIPIIALTAHALSDIKEKCQLVGMNHFVTKPLDFKKLDQVMVTVLKECGRL